MRVAVTGAGGFVGGAVAARLRADGHEVLALTRRDWDLASAPKPQHADAVVHCAALADDWAPLPHALRANVTATANVIQSFPGARFVHLSTSSVYDGFSPTVHATESIPLPTRWLSPYAESKARAETLFAGMDAAILRPHAVYGPGDTTLLPRILSGIRRGRLVLPAGARVPHTLTHIDNLVQAVVLALVPGAASGVFNVGDDGDVLLRDALHELLAHQGRADVAIASIPYAAAFTAAAALERLHRVAGGRPRLTRYAVSQLGRERTLDITRAREELGFRPVATSMTF